MARPDSRAAAAVDSLPDAGGLRRERPADAAGMFARDGRGDTRRAPGNDRRCGHMLTLEQPEHVSALLHDWLALRSTAAAPHPAAPVDDTAAEADLAVVQHRRLPRRDRPLRRVEVEPQRSAVGAATARRPRRPAGSASWRRSAPGAGARAGDPARVVGVQRASTAATDGRGPAPPAARCARRSLRATNQGACSAPPRAAPRALTPPMPRPWRWPSV